MSNVLIGIIGVILFIGLALAGALFLGPRFQQSVAQSKAAAMTTSLSQISQAIVMRGTTSGNTQGATGTLISDTVSEGFLKTLPTNPVVTGNAFNVGDELGSLNGNPVKWVYSSIGTDQKAKDLCAHIERAAGVTDPSDHVDTAVRFDQWVPSHRRVGCINNFYGGSYTVYAPV